MKRTQLRNIYLKPRTIESKLGYTKQRNYCLTLIRKGKKEYYGSPVVKVILDNQKFWKTVKPLFSDKSKCRRTVTVKLKRCNVTRFLYSVHSVLMCL